MLGVGISSGGRWRLLRRWNPRHPEPAPGGRDPTNSRPPTFPRAEVRPRPSVPRHLAGSGRSRPRGLSPGSPPDRRAEGLFVVGKGSGDRTGRARPPGGPRPSERGWQRGWGAAGGAARVGGRGGRRGGRGPVRGGAAPGSALRPPSLPRRAPSRSHQPVPPPRQPAKQLPERPRPPDPGAAPGPAHRRPRPWTRWPGCCPRSCCSARSTEAPGEREPVLPAAALGADPAPPRPG